MLVEAKVFRDKRPLSIQEKHHGASIDCFLQMDQVDDSQSHVAEKWWIDRRFLAYIKG